MVWSTDLVSFVTRAASVRTSVLLLSTLVATTHFPPLLRGSREVWLERLLPRCLVCLEQLRCQFLDGDQLEIRVALNRFLELVRRFGEERAYQLAILLCGPEEAGTA
jgi:hypothetical protein